MRCSSILAVVAFVLGCGCAPHSTSPPTIITPPTIVVTPTIPVVPETPPRTDLPVGYSEVRGDGWSYGLPGGFDKTENPIGVLARHTSLVTGLTVSFVTTPNDTLPPDGLQQFVLDKWLPQTTKQGSVVVAIGRNNKTTQFTTIVVQTVKPVVTTPSKISLDGALDFFMQKDNIVCHITCSGEATTLKTHSPICFKIAETLRVR